MQTAKGVTIASCAEDSLRFRAGGWYMQIFPCHLWQRKCLSWAFHQVSGSSPPSITLPEIAVHLCLYSRVRLIWGFTLPNRPPSDLTFLTGCWSASPSSSYSSLWICTGPAGPAGPAPFLDQKSTISTWSSVKLAQWGLDGPPCNADREKLLCASVRRFCLYHILYPAVPKSLSLTLTPWGRWFRIRHHGPPTSKSGTSHNRSS